MRGRGNNLQNFHALNESVKCRDRRFEVRGKFLFSGAEKVYIRGISYGPFRPVGGNEYCSPEKVEPDFRAIADNSFNCIRLYTVPDHWFLDLALQYRLHVLIGIPWEQHVAFLDYPNLPRLIVVSVKEAVGRCAGHPAVLGYALGNEIPASIVRWHGPRKVERFLYQLFEAGKSVDRDALFTYVNYPTTEYLRLPFLDFCSFNVYLESRTRLLDYLFRLQNVAGDLPLLITELGTDCFRNGEAKQAKALEQQIGAVFAGGCTGGIVFSWTDEWHRGGESVEDWAFGLTTKDRNPRPALGSVRKAFAELPFRHSGTMPKVSIIVCVRNGEETIGKCLEGLSKLEYPDFEIIVVDDGSEDATSKIIHSFVETKGFRTLTVDGQGLSVARNVGAGSASGEIVAFIDADAYPDCHWLNYLVNDLVQTEYAAVGGPSYPPVDSNIFQQSVSYSPGWPRPVLVSDREAEHIPGCNMAFWKRHLEEIDGFDPQFHTAGDDVDICWRIRERGWKIGFSPGAIVWHHPRKTVRQYWRQQRGYGRAETALERKWPSKYDDLGQVSWSGVIYGDSSNGYHQPPRIYHGVWGSSLFQYVYGPPLAISHNILTSWLDRFFSTPDSYLVVGLLLFLSLLGLLWKPLLLAVPALLIALALPVTEAFQTAWRASLRGRKKNLLERWKLFLMTASLSLVQPAARLSGRLGRSLRASELSRFAFALPRLRLNTRWYEDWRQPEKVLQRLESQLVAQGATVVRGGAFDRWDLEVQAGITAALRVRMAYEEHVQGKQLVRFRSWPRWPRPVFLPIMAFAFVAALALVDGSYLVGAVLSTLTLGGIARALIDAGSATSLWLRAVKMEPRSEVKL